MLSFLPISPRGLDSLVLTKKIAASGNEIAKRACPHSLYHGVAPRREGGLVRFTVPYVVVKRLSWGFERLIFFLEFADI